MDAPMGKDNRSWHRAKQRSPQELAEALASLAADVGEPSPRQRPRGTPAPLVREPWTDPSPERHEPELEAEPVPEAQDVRPPFAVPETEPVREMHAPAASQNLVEPSPAQREPAAVEPEPEAVEPEPEAVEREALDPEPVAVEPEPAAVELRPEDVEPEPEPGELRPEPGPPPGGLIVGRSLTAGEPPAPPAEPTSQEQWDDGPLPTARTPITARAAWTAQGVRSRAAGGRMRTAGRPRLGPGRAGYRPGPRSRRGLIWLVAGVLLVIVVLIIALGGGSSPKKSSTGSVRHSAAANPTASIRTVTIPPPATTATTPKRAAQAARHRARLRARCKVAKFRKHHPRKCH